MIALTDANLALGGRKAGNIEVGIPPCGEIWC